VALVLENPPNQRNSVQPIYKKITFTSRSHM
jgi:hypothetical protein